MPGRGFKVKFAPFTNPSLAVLMFPWSLTAHMLLLHKPTWDSMQEYEGTSLVRMDWKIQDFWALWKFWEFKGIAIWFSAAVNPWKAQCAHRISHPFCEVDLNNQGHCLVSCNTQIEGKKVWNNLPASAAGHAVIFLKAGAEQGCTTQLSMHWLNYTSLEN